MIDWKKEIKLPSPSSLRGRFSRPSMPGRPSLPGRGSVNAGAPRASGSGRGRPSLAKTGIKMPKTSVKTPNVKAPKFVNDLYADLRDRRLLPLVALLLVAIIAAPILLKDKGESEPAAPPIAAAPQTQPSDASFAVVPAEQGLRDYHKRLGHRTARNPFAQPSAKASSSGGGESNGGGAASVEATSGSSEVTPGGGEAAPAPEEAEAGAGSSSNPGSTSGSGSESGGAPASEAKPGNTTESTTSVVVEKEVTGYSIDAKVGYLQEIEPLIGLPEMTKLPSPKEPVAVYLGVSKDKKGALFLLDSLVSAYYGGHCTLDKQSCTVLELRPGKTVTLVYGLHQRRFKITLEQIRPEITENESGSTVTKSRSH